MNPFGDPILRASWDAALASPTDEEYEVTPSDEIVSALDEWLIRWWAAIFLAVAGMVALVILYLAGGVS